MDMAERKGILMSLLGALCAVGAMVTKRIAEGYGMAFARAAGEAVSAADRRARVEAIGGIPVSSMMLNVVFLIGALAFTVSAYVEDESRTARTIAVFLLILALIYQMVMV